MICTKRRKRFHALPHVTGRSQSRRETLRLAKQPTSNWLTQDIQSNFLGLAGQFAEIRILYKQQRKARVRITCNAKYQDIHQLKTKAPFHLTLAGVSVRKLTRFPPIRTMQCCLDFALLKSTTSRASIRTYLQWSPLYQYASWCNVNRLLAFSSDALIESRKNCRSSSCRKRSRFTISRRKNSPSKVAMRLIPNLARQKETKEKETKKQQQYAKKMLLCQQKLPTSP